MRHMDFMLKSTYKSTNYPSPSRLDEMKTIGNIGDNRTLAWNSGSARNEKVISNK